MSHARRRILFWCVACPVAFLIVASAFFPKFIGWQIVPMILAFPTVGALVVLRLVRWMNRRDDPRHAKPPPDHP